MAKAKKEVPVEQDKPYEELVNPDIAGEAAPRGERPNLGEFGPDTTDPNYTNEVNKK